MRFGGDAFSAPLTALLGSQLAPPAKRSTAPPSAQQTKDDAARIARQRVLIRAATELAIVGVLGPPGDDGDSVSFGLKWLYKIIRGFVRA